MDLEAAKRVTEREVQAKSVPQNSHVASCPMSALLETLTRPWTLHILWLLSRRGPMRFGALRRNVEGISARLLTLRLRTLEDAGFVRREAVHHGNLAEVTYSPTARALAMEEVMRLLERISRMPAETSGRAAQRTADTSESEREVA